MFESHLKKSIKRLNFRQHSVCLRQSKMTREVIKEEFLRHVLVPERYNKRQIDLRERLALIYGIDIHTYIHTYFI